MSATPDQISARMLAKLAISIPTMSCAVGTPERKILDCVGEAIAEAYVDQYLVGSILDIDTKTGAELDQFVGIFGFGRLQGSAASGVITVTATVPSSQDITYAASTQFYTTPGLAGIPTQLYYSSTQTVVMTANTTTCEIPVQCTTVGSAGNVPPSSITFAQSGLNGASCANLAAMTGGVDSETDAELRQRFKDTFLRNIAGTADWYESMCQQNTNVSRVVVYGPVSLYQTQIAVPSTELVLPVSQNVKYAWCLVPETRVLTEALEWVPVGSLGVGDKLIGFDEHQPSGRGKKRTWQQAEVTNTSTFEAETFEVCTSGPSVISTADHLWLVSKRGPLGHLGKKRGEIRNTQGTQWVKTKDLVPGDKIRYVPPWDQEDSFDAGYLAGVFDGEGDSPHSASTISISQNAGPVFDKIVALLKQYDFNSLKIYDKGGALSSDPSCKQIVINGGVDNMMRFHSLFRSERLSPKFLQHLYGSTIFGGGRGVERGARYAEVISVEPRGGRAVVALGTSTQTLVAEGLLSHNSDMESCFTNLGQENETFFSSVNDYVYEGGSSPTFTTVSTGALAALVGSVVDFEFQFTSKCSRNDPVNGITNKVDIITDGTNPYAVTEQSVVSAAVLSSTSSDALYTGNFARVGSAGTPTAGNRFQRLGSTPILNFPSTLTIGGTVYTMGTHYFLLQDTTLLAGTQVETSGIEWSAEGPATGTEMTLSYVYNQVPEILNALISASKQICTDVMVHQADFVFIQPCLQVEYATNYSPATVNSSIASRLQQYFAQLPFGGWVYLSNICMYVQQTLGVVNVSVTTSGQNSSNYGIQIFDNSSNPDPTTVQTTDFQLNDNQLAYYQGVLIQRVATP